MGLITGNSIWDSRSVRVIMVYICRVILICVASMTAVFVSCAARAEDTDKGFERLELKVDGVVREALFYAPVSSKTNAAPLVFVFHGHGGSSRNAIRSFGINRQWPEAISVYMQGLNTPGRLTDPLGKKPGWQHGPGDQADRDLKFFDTVLAHLKKNFKVDAGRIYATGHSNGGSFTYLLWAARCEVFAAFAPSGAIGTFHEMLRSKPAMHIAGEKDPLVRFEWQEKMMNVVRKINGCESEGREWAGKCTIYPSANGTPLVTFLYPGGHQFPGEAPALIVKFFKEHPARQPDISLVPADLAVPGLIDGEPAPGKRVLQALPAYRETSVHHALYLPTDWEKGKKYPVLVEYAGNGRTVAGGQPCLGYGISGGTGFVWATLPYVGQDRHSETKTWWGDLGATVSYCKETVRLICREWGGDSNNVFIAGFSRGSIACNVIGLHDDEIAGLWKGFICHSHYDDGRWSGTDAAGAMERIRRLGKKPQFISNEIPVVEKEKIEQYLGKIYPAGNFTFVTLPFTTHTETWVLRDTEERKTLRDWVNKLVSTGKPELNKMIPLWPGKPARLTENTQAETIDEHGTIRMVSVPAISVHLPPPEKNTGMAVIMCPGGGYGGLDWKTHVTYAANVFNSKGVAVIGLKYRTRPPNGASNEDIRTIALLDAQRAVRFVRGKADDWRINPRRIGIAGYSAGANLAMNLAANFNDGDPRADDPVERQSCRPDFAVGLATWHWRQKESPFTFRKETPPVFLVHATNDGISGGAPIELPYEIKTDLEALGVPVRMEVFDEGGHGVGNLIPNRVEKGFPPAKWPDLFLQWMTGVLLK